MITTTVFQARGSQQDCSGGNRRTQEAEVWRDRGWRLCDGPPGTPGQVQDEESSPEGRHVHDGAGEETQALRPALRMLLQLIVNTKAPAVSSEEGLFLPIEKGHRPSAYYKLNQI